MASTMMAVTLKLRWRARVFLLAARALAWALSRVLGATGIPAGVNIVFDETKCDADKLYHTSIDTLPSGTVAATGGKRT